MKKKIFYKKFNVWIILILLLGTFLRLYGLGDESFWTDESATVYASKMHPKEIFDNIYHKIVLLPAYFAKGGGEMPTYYIMIYY